VRRAQRNVNEKSPTLCLSAQGGFNIVFVLFIVDFAAAVRTKHLFAAAQNAEKMPAKRASNLYKHNRKRRNNEYNTTYAQTSSKAVIVYYSNIDENRAKQKYDR
jgi:hypothetical protein